MRRAFLCLLVLVGSASAQISLTRSSGTEVRALYFRNDFEGAIMAAEKGLARNSSDLALAAWRVLSLASNDRVEEALTAAEKLTAAHPQNPWSRFALAGALSQHSTRGAESLAVSEEALAKNPKHHDFIWLRADVLRRRQKYTEAIAFVEAQRAPTPELLVVKARAVRGIAIAKPADEMKNEEALALMAEIRRRDPRNVNAYYQPGRYLLDLNRPIEGYPLLKRAVELAPAATLIHKEYWRAMRNLPDWNLARKLPGFERDIAVLLTQSNEAAGALYAVANLYDSLKLTEKKTEVEERLLARYAQSSEAEWVVYTRQSDFSQAMYKDGRQPSDVEKAKNLQMLRDFIARPIHHRKQVLGQAYMSLFLALDPQKTDAQELRATINGMLQYETLNPHITYPRAAVALAERKIDFREAERIARAGIEAGKKRIEGQRAGYKTEADYEEGLNWMTSFMYSALGWVFFNEGRIDDAERELKQAIKLSAKQADPVYYLGRLYEGRAEFEQAEQQYIKGAAIQSIGENKNRKALKDLYLKRGGNLDAYEAYIARLEEKERAIRRTEILSTRLAAPKPLMAFNLKTLDGNSLAAESLRGKIVAINMWGMWCGPCMKEMPDIQKLHQKYRGDSEVVILTIDTQDDPEEVRAWMKKNSYDFRILLNDDYLARAEVNIYPTTWFIDREGKIAFIKEGWSEKLVEEFSWRIESLKEKTLN